MSARAGSFAKLLYHTCGGHVAQAAHCRQAREELFPCLPALAALLSYYTTPAPPAQTNAARAAVGRIPSRSGGPDPRGDKRLCSNQKGKTRPSKKLYINPIKCCEPKCSQVFDKNQWNQDWIADQILSHREPPVASRTTVPLSSPAAST